MYQQFKRKKHQILCQSRVLKTRFMSRRLLKLKPVIRRRSVFSSKESMCKIKPRGGEGKGKEERILGYQNFN